MNTNNTVRPVDSINIVTVVTDETQVNVTRPVTNVVRVVGPGPIGPVGPQGIQGETGLTVTDLFVARGNDTWSTTGSLQISGSLTVSQSIVGLSGFTGSLRGIADTASYFAGYGNSSVLINQHTTYNTFTESIQTQVDGLSNATSSYVLNNVTASMLQPYVLTSVTQSMLRPYVLTSVTSSMLQPYVLTSVTASMLQPYVLTSVTASMLQPYVLTSVTSSMLQPYVLTSITQSMLQPYVLTSVTASMLQPYVLTSVTASMLQPYVLTSVTSSMLQPYVLTSVTSSMLQPYVLTSVTSSMIVSGALTASFVNTLNQSVVITGSLNVSGSVFIPALTNDGQLYVLTYNTTSGRVYYTGSTSIGGVPQGNVGQIQYNNNSLLGGVPTLIYTDSLLKATGSFSGSFKGSGSGNFDGTFTGNFTGSLLGTAATASFVTSSNVLGPHSFNSILSASYAVTASYVNILTQDVTISGSLFISGSTVQTGNVTLQGNHVQAGTMILSGSNVITGSLSLVGDARVTGSLLLTQSHISTVDYIDYRVIQTHPSHLEGRTHWLDDTKTLQIDTDVNNFSIEIGHQNIVRARNVTGFDLVAGKVVYINGESGNRPTITTASWDGDSTSAATLGFVAQQIDDNQTGYVVTNGMLRGIDTTDFAPGTQLYLSSSGNYTSTVPISPKHEVRLGKTITQANDGVIYVDVMNGYELGELHDVLINSSTNGDLVVKSGSLWINSKQLTGSYGLTGSLNVSGSTAIVGSSVISGSLNVTGSLYANFAYLTGSLLGTTATASFVTSSNVQGPYGMNSVVSASHAVTVRSYAQLIGDGATNNITVTHGLGTNDLHITVYSASGNFENIIPDIHRTDTNTIQVRFVNPPTLNQYRVYISV